MVDVVQEDAFPFVIQAAIGKVDIAAEDNASPVACSWQCDVRVRIQPDLLIIVRGEIDAGFRGSEDLQRTSGPVNYGVRTSDTDAGFVDLEDRSGIDNQRHFARHFKRHAIVEWLLTECVETDLIGNVVVERQQIAVCTAVANNPNDVARRSSGRSIVNIAEWSGERSVTAGCGILINEECLRLRWRGSCCFRCGTGPIVIGTTRVAIEVAVQQRGLRVGRRDGVGLVVDIDNVPRCVECEVKAEVVYPLRCSTEARVRNCRIELVITG